MLKYNTILEVLNLLKGSIKFLLRENYRANKIREISIRKKQNEYLNLSFTTEAPKVIIFLIDGADQRTGKELLSGGLMSIASIYDETRKLKNVHAAEVFICTHPFTNLLLHFTQFQSDAVILRLEQVLKHFQKTDSYLFHVPEYLFPLFCDLVSTKTYRKFFTDKALHVNILNQNIKLMPSADLVRSRKNLFSKLTMTTAHERYSTEEVQALYNIPLHKLSVYGGPERYELVPYDQKESLMIVSPDFHPQKEQILNELTSKFPGLKIQIIKGIPYTEYLMLVRKAKWALTFGEGLDYYFLETVFSGGISFAIFNKNFFTPEFEFLDTVYPEVTELAKLIVHDIARLDEKASFNSYNKVQWDICSKLYKHEEYLQNIKSFYEERYTF